MNRTILIVTLVLLPAGLACSKKQSTPTEPAATTPAAAVVCVGGSRYIGSIRVPGYWQDGVRHDLPYTGYTGADVYGIAVSGGTVSCAGSLYISDDYACSWLNGAMQVLPCGTHASEAYGMTVSGGTLYSGGFYYTTTGTVPCYWAGTARHDLSADSTVSAQVNGIAVSGGTVYCAGSYNSSGTAWAPCYWA
ncbi:MAG TPA: hypothetical protein VMF29_06740, partial [Candidatus Edwardsbacteria bacterium]|nr:hypothetical protein [Candidatus Edwardsbacteria bacterium]